MTDLPLFPTNVLRFRADKDTTTPTFYDLTPIGLGGLLYLADYGDHTARAVWHTSGAPPRTGSMRGGALAADVAEFVALGLDDEILIATVRKLTPCGFRAGLLMLLAGRCDHAAAEIAAEADLRAASELRAAELHNRINVLRAGLADLKETP